MWQLSTDGHIWQFRNCQIITANLLRYEYSSIDYFNIGIYGNVIRFLSPLVITDEQLEVGFTILEKAIEKVAEMI